VSPLKDLNFLLAVIIAGVALAIFPSCIRTSSVAAHEDPAVDYSRYETFAIVDTPGLPEESLAAQSEMRSAAAAVMARKGFVPAAPENADVLVLVHGGATRPLALPQAGFGYGRFRPWGYGGGPYELSQPRSGAFVVDVFDAQTRELVWRGMAGEPFRDTDLSHLHAAVETAAAQFPR
jgi:hypothetical protein